MSIRVVLVLGAILVGTIAASAAPVRFTRVGKNVRLSIDQLATAENPGGEYQREPHIAVDPTDPRHLLAGAIEGRRDSDGFPLAVGYYESFDGGATWSAGLIPGVSEASGSTEYQFVVDPVVAFGPDGTMFFASLSLNPEGATAVHVSHTVTTDVAPGHEWESPIAVATHPSGEALDKPWIAVDHSVTSPHYGRIYVAWIQFGSGLTPQRMFVSHSDDGGHAWSTPVQITSDRIPQGAQILIERTGAVSVVYSDTAQIRIVRSIDGGDTWGAPVTVSNFQVAPIPGQRTGEYLPSATIDPASQTMHVVWQDSRRDVADIFHSRSQDSGATWSRPKRVNAGPRGLESFNAAVAARGRSVHVVFYDGRDSRDRRDLYNLFYAQSIDDGATFFRRNVRVTSMSFDIDYAAPSARGLFLGDYIGIVALPRRAHAVWVDTRRPSQVRDSPGQNDVFSARISP